MNFDFYSYTITFPGMSEKEIFRELLIKISQESLILILLLVASVAMLLVAFRQLKR